MDLLHASEPGHPGSDGIARSITYRGFYERHRRNGDAFPAAIFAVAYDCVIMFQDEQGFAHIVRPFDEQWCEHHFDEMRGDAHDLDDFQAKAAAASPGDPVWRVPLEMGVRLNPDFYVPGDDKQAVSILDAEMDRITRLSKEARESDPFWEEFRKRAIDDASDWLYDYIGETDAGSIRVDDAAEVISVGVGPDLDFSEPGIFREDDEG